MDEDNVKGLGLGFGVADHAHEGGALAGGAAAKAFVDVDMLLIHYHIVAAGVIQQGFALGGWAVFGLILSGYADIECCSLHSDHLGVSDCGALLLRGS